MKHNQKITAYFLSFLLCSSILMSCKSEKKKTEVSVSKDATLTQLDSIIKANPSNADAYYRRANYFLTKMQLGEATTDIEKAIEIDSTNANYYVTIADIHLITNQSSKCKSALDKSLSVDSNNIDALLKMSELYMYVKENIQSIKYSNRVLDIDKGNSKAYFLIGMNQKELHDTTRAVLAFQEAINHNQDDYNAYVQLGLIYAAKNNPLALNYYTNASNIFPKNPEPYYNKGVYYQLHNEPQKAGVAYEQALQLNGSYKNALFNLAILNIETKKEFSKAIILLERFVQLEPSSAIGHFRYAQCLQNLGDKTKAQTEFAKAKELDPNNPEIANQ